MDRGVTVPRRHLSETLSLRRPYDANEFFRPPIAWLVPFRFKFQNRGAAEVPVGVGPAKFLAIVGAPFLAPPPRAFRLARRQSGRPTNRAPDRALGGR